MAKVSVGLRGWRFDEDEIFTADGEIKPLDQIPEDPRERLVRLVKLIEEPCDVCYLEYGADEIHRCNQATVVYGEPRGEVLCCSAHEREFLYWFREAGGHNHVGDHTFGDRFHEWIAAGNSAPADFETVEHVDEDPDALPDPPSQRELQERLERGFDGDRIDIRALAGVEPVDEEERLTDEDLANADVDLSTDYPSNR